MTFPISISELPRPSRLLLTGPDLHKPVIIKLFETGKLIQGLFEVKREEGKIVRPESVEEVRREEERKRKRKRR